MPKVNQTPEQKARDNIDAMLGQVGWLVQDKKKIDFSALASASPSANTRRMSAPPTTFSSSTRNPIGVVGGQAGGLGPEGPRRLKISPAATRTAKLKWLNNQGAAYPSSTRARASLTRFTDTRDPKPRSREVFSFPRPERMGDWLNQSASLRTRLRGLPDLDPTGPQGVPDQRHREAGGILQG